MRLRLLLFPLLATVGGQSTGGNITVDDPRPVAAAIQVLERQFGVPITYEDPTYRYSGDSVDHTAIPNPTHRAIDPLGGRLEVRGLQVGDGPLPALAEILRVHEARGYAGIFRVAQVSSFIEVIPSKTRDVNGAWIDDHPLLDTRLTFPARTVTAWEALDSICKAISAATGRSLWSGTIPNNLFLQSRVELKAEGERARDVLVSVLNQLRVPLSWRLLSDGESRQNALNIHVVRRE